MYLLLIGLSALVICYMGVAAVRGWALRRNLVDIPNERSSHTDPTPRGGGLAIAAIILVGFVGVQVLSPGLPRRAFLGYLFGALLVAAISGCDDLFSISAKTRLPIHLLAAGLFAMMAGYVDRIYLPFLGTVELGWVGFPITLMWIAGFTNAFNFMDGIDGIAAGQAIVTASCWIVVNSVFGSAALTTLSVLVAGASLGFLLHNLPPARIFMGDVGSTVLGYTFATLPVLAFKQARDSRLLVVGALCVAPFVFDTALTMIRRAFRKEQLFQAHRTHLYQRLTRLGYVHGSVTLLYLGIGTVSSLMALAYLWGNDLLGIIALSVVAILLLLIAAAVNWLERTNAAG
jgi:UDP-N-acetylmuramyl pentapeptide phosphotransferase/UDP-N-acetylglucosamine-1-phosphate transferase